jgi:hypothetical protein
MDCLNKDKNGVKLKFPDRTCKECKRYPCFIGIENTLSDFAKYGCIFYSDGFIGKAPR